MLPARIGSIQRFAADLLCTSTGIDFVHVPYKGGASVMTEVVAGRIDIKATNAESVKRFNNTGELKLLAQAGNTRHALPPHVLTTAEAGIPDIVIWSDFGVLGPASLPPPIVTRIAKQLTIVVEPPATAQPYIEIGAETALKSFASFGQVIAQEIQ